MSLSAESLPLSGQLGSVRRPMLMVPADVPQSKERTQTVLGALAGQLTVLEGPPSPPSLAEPRGPAGGCRDAAEAGPDSAPRHLAEESLPLAETPLHSAAAAVP